MAERKFLTVAYKVGCLIPGESGYSFNSQVFATKDEAVSSGKETMNRWFIPEGFDIIEVEANDEPVNYLFQDGKAKRIPDGGLAITIV